MIYRILADAVVFLHLLWILFLIFGGLLGVKYRAAKLLHAAGLVFAVTIQVFGWYCPFTHLEVWLRSRHDPSLSYIGSFIIHYLEELIYIRLSPALIMGLTLLLCGFNAWLYLGRKRS